MSNLDNFIISLELMGKGMAGIFAAILVIVILVQIMGKVGRKTEKSSTNKSGK